MENEIIRWRIQTQQTEVSIHREIIEFGDFCRISKTGSILLIIYLSIYSV